MNSYLKRALVRFLQPTIDELVQAAIEHQDEQITKMAEEAVESSIDSANISHSVELEISDQVRNYNFDHEIEAAINDSDIDKIIEEKVELEVAAEIGNTVEEAMHEATLKILDNYEFRTDSGELVVIREKR
jgi:hypothetical protein